MTDAERAKADCYADGDRDLMVWSQKIRASMLRPLLKLLARLGVTADVVTLVSLVLGLAFCPVYFFSKPLALALLVLHVCADGLDGPMARFTATASRKGSFTDTMSDQLVVVATTITLMYARTIGATAGGTYIFLYTVVVLFAMVRNVLAIPYSWLVRPRFAVYAWMIVETYCWPGSIDYVLWSFNALLAVKLLTGFIRIRQRI